MPQCVGCARLALAGRRHRSEKDAAVLMVWETFAAPLQMSADFIHPYPAAGKQIAVTFTREIAGGLNRFKQRQGSAVR